MLSTLRFECRHLLVLCSLHYFILEISSLLVMFDPQGFQRSCFLRLDALPHCLFERVHLSLMVIRCHPQGLCFRLFNAACHFFCVNASFVLRMCSKCSRKLISIVEIIVTNIHIVAFHYPITTISKIASHVITSSKIALRFALDRLEHLATLARLQQGAC